MAAAATAPRRELVFRVHSVAGETAQKPHRFPAQLCEQLRSEQMVVQAAQGLLGPMQHVAQEYLAASHSSSSKPYAVDQ